MSLINKVLKDLDRRQQQAGHHGRQGSAVELATHSRWRWVSIVLAVVLIAVSVLLLWPAGQSVTKSVSKPAAAEASLTQTSVAPQQNATPPAEPAEEEQSSMQTTAAADQPSLASPSKSQSEVDSDAGKAEIVVSDTPLEQLMPEPEPKTETARKEPSFSKQSVQLSAAEIASRAVEKAQLARQRGLFSEAVEYFQQALQARPDLHSARKEWAALEFGRGQISRALSILREGLAAYPQAHSLRLLAATILQRQEQPQLALRLLEQQQPAARALPEYYQLQAELAQQQKNLPLMTSSYRALTEAEPDNGRWFLGLALSLRNTEPQQAIAAFERAASLVQHQPTLEFIATQIQTLRSQHEATTP